MCNKILLWLSVPHEFLASCIIFRKNISDTRDAEVKDFFINKKIFIEETNNSGTVVWLKTSRSPDILELHNNIPLFMDMNGKMPRFSTRLEATLILHEELKKYELFKRIDSIS